MPDEPCGGRGSILGPEQTQVKEQAPLPLLQLRPYRHTAVPSLPVRRRLPRLRMGRSHAMRFGLSTRHFHPKATYLPEIPPKQA